MMRTLSLLTTLTLCGCVSPRPGPVATADDKEQATPAYWYDQPGVAQATGDNYDALWRTADRVARDRLFDIDRQDYRNGVMTTQPLVSQQLFEPWRRDTPVGGQIQSTLGTVRRTIRYEFTRDDNGQAATVTPKVLIERQSLPDRRITGSVHYRAAIAGTPAQVDDDGDNLPTVYWYPIARDADLEKSLASDIRKRMSDER